MLMYAIIDKYMFIVYKLNNDKYIYVRHNWQIYLCTQ